MRTQVYSVSESLTARTFCSCEAIASTGGDKARTCNGVKPLLLLLPLVPHVSVTVSDVVGQRLLSVCYCLCDGQSYNNF